MDEARAGSLPGAAVIDGALGELARVSSAARHGDQLAAVVVDAHAAGFRRLLELADDPAALTGAGRSRVLGRSSRPLGSGDSRGRNGWLRPA